MKKIILLVVMISALALWTAPASASLSLSLTSNNSGLVCLVLSGLDAYLPTTPVANFDISLQYNNPSLNLVSVDFGTGLGKNVSTDMFDPVADAWVEITPNPGGVRLVEQSWLFPDALNLLQSNTILLAAVKFTGADFDTITIKQASLSDKWGNSMSTVPVPPSVLLLGSGLVGLLASRKRFRTK